MAQIILQRSCILGVNKSEVDLPHCTGMVTVFPLAQVAVNATEHVHTGSLMHACPPVVIALDRSHCMPSIQFVLPPCHGRCILLSLIFYFERHVTVRYFT